MSTSYYLGKDLLKPLVLVVLLNSITDFIELLRKFYD
jgi:hypothetical protein